MHAYCFRALAAILVALAIPAGHALAASSYDSCTGFIDSLPATISAPGTWCLRKDLSTATIYGSAITVQARNVTIDCNDFKLGGLQAGIGTDADGVYANLSDNLVVRHCSIRGFGKGMRVQQSPGSLIEDNRLEGNTLVGIELDGEGAVVRRNLVLDTGGSSTDGNNALAISVGGNYVDVLDNTISGVSAAQFAVGVYTTATGSVHGNHVTGLVAPNANGIYSGAYDRMTLRNNTVIHTGGTGVGLRCEPTSLSRALHNTVNGFATAIQGCRNDGNSL